DVVRDFTPITLALRAPSMLMVHPSLPVKSTKELIALAKARPGQLNYSSGGNASSPHLAMELFKSLAHVDMVHIPHKGVPAGVIDLAAGNTQVGFASWASAGAHVKAGRLRALGVGSLEPSTLYPGLPTIASALPGYESLSMMTLMGPA